MNEEEYHPQVIVAAVDVLGMGNLLTKNDQSVSAANALQGFLFNGLHSGGYTEPSWESRKIAPMFDNAFNFGDSIYFFGDPKRPLSEQGHYLLVKCASLIALGLTMHMAKEPRGFLVRAGIASGDLRLRRATRPGDNVEIETRIGTAMLKAQRLQEAQQWIGGAVEATVPRSAFPVYRVPYAVPWNKDKHAVKFPVEAIDWVRVGTDNPSDASLTPALEKLREMAAAAEDASVRAKWNNTLAFVEKMRATRYPCDP